MNKKKLLLIAVILLMDITGASAHSFDLKSSDFPTKNSYSSSSPKKKKMHVRTFNLEFLMPVMEDYDYSLGPHIILAYERGGGQRGWFRIGGEVGFLNTRDNDYASIASHWTASLMLKAGFELGWKENRVKFGFGNTIGWTFKIGFGYGLYCRLTCYITGRFAIYGSFRTNILFEDGNVSLIPLAGLGFTYQLKK